MARNPNTDKGGSQFSKPTIDAIWMKAKAAAGPPQNERRYDAYGQLIKYSEYGNTNSPYGWEIDHVFPIARGGGDELSNLQPLQWENNRKKGDLYPYLVRP